MQILPKWLTRNDDDFEFPPIPTATMPPRGEIKMEETAEVHTNGNGVDLSTSAPSMSEQLRNAADKAEKHEADRAKWAESYAKVSETIRDLKRENEFLRLELTQKANDVQTMQSRIYELQQEVSDYIALQSQQHAAAKFLVTQYENAKIPLAVRKRVKNGNKEKPVLTEIPKETIEAGHSE